MNKLIKELHDKAFDGIDILEANWFLKHNKKFAELIVLECMKMCDEVHRDYGMASDTARISKRYIKKHFGVEE